jgi:hypothetical protein
VLFFIYRDGPATDERDHEMTTTGIDLQKPETWDDETLDAALVQSDLYRWAAGTDDVLGVWANRVLNEAGRRAEIKLNRAFDAKYGPNPFGFTTDDVAAKHDASWYESRQTEEQWLSEVEGQPESGTYRLF